MSKRDLYDISAEVTCLSSMVFSLSCLFDDSITPTNQTMNRAIRSVTEYLERISEDLTDMDEAHVKGGAENE